MADEAEKKRAPEQGAAAPKRSGGAGAVLGAVLTALVAAAGAFGGARLGAPAMAGQAQEGASPSPAATMRPPGATVGLDPFLVTVADAQGKPRAIKVTIALELREGAKEDALRPFVPRVRDAMLTYLRTLSYEDVADSGHAEQMRSDLLERFARLGALSIERVLVTDFVTQ